MGDIIAADALRFNALQAIDPGSGMNFTTHDTSGHAGSNLLADGMACVDSGIG